MSLVDKNEISRRLKELIENLSTNSRQFALGAGLDVSYFAKIEGGEKPLSSKYLEKIETSYNVNRDWLLTGKGEMFGPNVPHEMHKEEKVETDSTKHLGKNPSWTAIMKVADGNKVLYEANKSLADANLILARNNEKLVAMLERRLGKAPTMDLTGSNEEGKSKIHKNHEANSK